MSWPVYFPFREGEDLSVEAKLSFLPPVRATASVREVTERRLVLDYAIPPVSVWLKTYPGATGTLTVVERESGAPHSASVSVDGKVHETHALRMDSSPEAAHRRFFVPTKEPGKEASFCLRRLGEDRMEIGDFSDLPKLAAGLKIVFTRK